MYNNFKIVCPVDFSECSLNAIEYAAKLGEKYQATLYLFHVPNKEDYQKLSSNGLMVGDQYSFINKKLGNLVQTVKVESIPLGLKACEAQIKDGEIVETILEFANEIKANLIIMGTEGVNDFKKNYIGSRSADLIGKSEIDVLMIPRKVFFKVPRKFVYATDYHDEDKLAIQKVVQLAIFYDSEIDMVHVSSRARGIDKLTHQSMISELSPLIKYEKIAFVLKTYRDSPGLGLENYLISAKGDILITLSKKKSWFDQLFAQNLSKKMSYFINKPLYVIKQP
ncbi:universal stress protein [Belliella sp. DSM 107340]|uniref:Universal stress protein n=1 Tax=Belliella calami TaxID=2923436 RepID=A0ABS9US66_9BACT|nr:universal stress protein [Belliella calami]MCH7399451.1 universal stress protein [Belliella calami]